MTAYSNVPGCNSNAYCEMSDILLKFVTKLDTLLIFQLKRHCICYITNSES